MGKTIAVYGAYGHTGKFIVAQLRDMGFTPILCGRDEEKLLALGAQHPGLATTVAAIHEPDALDRAFAPADLLVNCAGPFLDSAEPLIQSALRLGKHYLDVSAEQEAVRNVFEQFADAAEQAEIVMVPAVAFYGGLADLLSTSLTQGWSEIDEITVYIGLSSWHPTKGTRITGQRNHYPRVIFANGELQPLQAGAANWNFPEPIGAKEMSAVPFSEIITISRHLKVKNISTYISLNSLQDIRNTATPEPTPADDKNRSSQEFCVQVLATHGNESRTITAQGRDIYAVTAPLVGEAVKRILAGNTTGKGVAAMGEVFDAADFLQALNPEDIVISEIHESVRGGQP